VDRYSVRLLRQSRGPVVALRLPGLVALNTRQAWIRYILLAFAWLVSIGIIVVSIGWVDHIWHSVAKTDRVTDIGAIFTFATLLLGLIAGLVAISAYAVSTGQPNLKVRILFSYQDHFNQPVFETVGETEPGYDEDKVIAAGESWTKVAYIWIKNSSSYSAKSPAVIISLDPDYSAYPKMAIPRELPGPTDEKDSSPSKPANDWNQSSWKDIEFSANGKDVFAMQWDGGPYPIHGHSIRRLPNLSFDGLFCKSSEGQSTIELPASNGKCEVPVHAIVMRVELLADGYRRRVPITVTFVPKGKQAEVADKMAHPDEWE
jgi:hypothetical protein